jgi:hypothetical protein
MAVGGEDKNKKYFWEFKMNPREVFYEISPSLSLDRCIGTLKIMASTGVFVRVVFALKRSISRVSHTSRMAFSPTHKRTEGRAPVWSSEFTTKDVHYRGESADFAHTGGVDPIKTSFY